MAGRIIKAIGERREWNRAALHPSVIWSGNYFHHTSQCQFSLYPSTSGFLSSTRFSPIDLHLCLLSCLFSTCFCHFLFLKISFFIKNIKYFIITIATVIKKKKKRQLILIITALCLVAGKFCYWWVRALLHLCHEVTCSQMANYSSVLSPKDHHRRVKCLLWLKMHKEKNTMAHNFPLCTFKSFSLIYSTCIQKIWVWDLFRNAPILAF